MFEKRMMVLRAPDPETETKEEAMRITLIEKDTRIEREVEIDDFELMYLTDSRHPAYPTGRLLHDGDKRLEMAEPATVLGVDVLGFWYVDHDADLCDLELAEMSHIAVESIEDLMSAVMRWEKEQAERVAGERAHAAQMEQTKYRICDCHCGGNDCNDTRYIVVEVTGEDGHEQHQDASPPCLTREQAERWVRAPDYRSWLECEDTALHVKDFVPKVGWGYRRLGDVWERPGYQFPGEEYEKAVLIDGKVRCRWATKEEFEAFEAKAPIT